MRRRPGTRPDTAARPADPGGPPGAGSSGLGGPAGAAAGSSGSGEPAGDRVVGRSARERGSAALFVAVFAPAMIFLAGLVIDGGAAIEARQRASDIAEQAARAAAGQCDVAVLRSKGVCRITNDVVARQAAAPFLENNGVTDSDVVRIRQVDPNEYEGVQVTVTITFDTTLLGIVPKYKTLTITETAEAIAVTGL